MTRYLPLYRRNTKLKEKRIVALEEEKIVK